MSNKYTRDTQGRKRVTLISGDGIGPEVVAATKSIIDAAGVALAWEEADAGAEVFRRGVPSGVPVETIDSIARNRVALKGPLETPIGFGEKSANVTLRKLFETYGNLRPVREIGGVRTRFSGMGVDLVVVRENVEDLYAGIEHQQTPTVAQCLKLMSESGCEKIVRLGFEVARAQGRKSVHCATKANIMKLTEGLMKRVFEAVAAEYPEIEAHHILIDNCAHQLVRFPESFEVIVTSNMNGDILSDLTSGLIGGLGFAPGANLGSDVAIFEAVHGSAPKYAGRDVANPTAVLLSATMMLRHLDEGAAAERIENALFKTFEDGVYTQDVNKEGAVGTRAFTEAVIARLGQRPAHGAARPQGSIDLERVVPKGQTRVVTERVPYGADVFVEARTSPNELGQLLTSVAEGSPLQLKMISNRGTKVYPSMAVIPDCVDHWRCRFQYRGQSEQFDSALVALLERIGGSSVRWMHLEKLELHDGAPAFTRAQGED